MAVYMVDYENVHDEGLKGIELLDKNDKVYIFHNNIDNKNIWNSVDNVKARVTGIPVETGIPNALDFQLCSYLGYLIHSRKEKMFFIITKDNFGTLISDFWNQLIPYNKILSNLNIKRRKSIKNSILLQRAKKQNHLLKISAKKVEKEETLKTSSTNDKTQKKLTEKNPVKQNEQHKSISKEMIDNQINKLFPDSQKSKRLGFWTILKKSATVDDFYNNLRKGNTEADTTTIKQIITKDNFKSARSILSEQQSTDNSNQSKNAKRLENLKCQLQGKKTKLTDNQLKIVIRELKQSTDKNDFYKLLKGKLTPDLINKIKHVIDAGFTKFKEAVK